MTRSIPRRLALALTVTLGVGFAAASAAVASTTAEGPYGPVSAIDYGSCLNAWANFSGLNSTYRVSKINLDGSYNVTLRTAGKFVTNAGSSPGACGSGTDNGDHINANAKGRVNMTFYLVVTGGTFDSSATCDVSCASDPYPGDTSGISNFVAAFFGGSATWSFSTVKSALEVATSANPALCLNKWTATTTGNSATTSSTGDIATTCN